jgi:hypothetical protein
MTPQNNEQTIVKQHKKAGRPTKYEPETVQRLLAALSDGLTIKQGCLAAGIGQSTLSDWLERHPELAAQLNAAREQARQKALAAIKAAGEAGDWKAWESFLRHSFVADYRQASTKIDVAATAGTQHTKIEVVCDEATRSALIEGREKFLTATKKPQPEGPKLQPGVPIGATHAPEDPKITFMKSLEGCITDDQILTADLGRFGNID